MINLFLLQTPICSNPSVKVRVEPAQTVIGPSFLLTTPDAIPQNLLETPDNLSEVIVIAII